MFEKNVFKNLRISHRIYKAIESNSTWYLLNIYLETVKNDEMRISSNHFQGVVTYKKLPKISHETSRVIFQDNNDLKNLIRSLQKVIEDIFRNPPRGLQKKSPKISLET